MAVVAVAAVVAGMLGTANAMFLSQHDFDVVLWVSLVAGLVAVLVRDGGRDGVRPLVALAARRRPGVRRQRAVRLGQPRTRRAAGARRRAGAHQREAGRVAARREARLEESRRELVSWVSHDLRTPLAGMRAMTEALEDDMADDPARYHRQIRVEVDRMVRQVDDLFELSRIHAGVLSLSLQPVVLGDLVSEAIAAADPVAQARRVRLGGAVEEGIRVTADPAGLSRVVSNLVMNAIRHTPADGVVEIRGRAGARRRRAQRRRRLRRHLARGHGAGLRRRVAGERRRARPTPTRSRAAAAAGSGWRSCAASWRRTAGTVAVENEVEGCRFRVLLPT